MSPGPVDIATNIAIRNRVRADLLLPRPVDLAGEIGIEDLDAEQLARLDKLRLFNARFLGAIKGGDPAAIAATRPPPAAGLPRGTGILRTLAGDFDAVTATSDLSFGPIGFPYIIRHLHIAGTNFGVAGSNGEVQLRLFLTGEDLTGDTQAAPGPLIFPDFRGGTSTSTMVKVTGGASVATLIPVAIPVLETGRFLTAVAVMTPAADVRAALVIIIEEIAGGPGYIGSLIPVGRININPSTRPPPPRTVTPSHPRGATIRVTSGGQVIAQRIIAWESLAPEIKRLWFNQQVGAPPDPSVQWLL